MILGLDIGGTKCAAILGLPIANNFRIMDKYVVSTKTEYLLILDELMQWAMKKEREYGGKIERIGISCGGPLSRDRQYILSPPNLPGWDGVPVIQLVKSYVGMAIPVHMENDADACALAEWQFGAGKGTRNMIFLTFGTGLGAGLILNGNLYRGTSGMAGEIGHIRMSKDGPVGYNKSGSLEGFASGGGILQLAKRAGFSQDNMSAKTVIEAAKKGDILAKEVIRESAIKLGHGLAILIDVLNPECIVIGSIFTRATRLFLPHIEDVLKKECLDATLGAVRIVPAELGEQIGDYGAICAAIINE